MSEPQDHVDLRIYILEDSQIEFLSANVFKKYPVLELRCPRGLQEADFLDLLRSTFPQLAAGKLFDFFTTDRTKRLQPLRVETLTPEEIRRTTGHSALYIRLKPPEEVHVREEELLQREDTAAKVSLSTDPTVLTTRRKPDRCQISETQDHVYLSVRILEDSQINVITPSVYKTYSLLDLRCPRGLQEEDFLDLLRSTFPQMAAQKPFDFFISDRNRTLQPLKVETLTPEEIRRTVGHSALYIRLKEQEEVQANKEELQDSSSSSDQTRLNTSCSTSQHEDMETEEDGGRSELSESEEVGGEVIDDDCKREKHLSESEAEKQRVQRSGLEILSPVNASAGNGGAPVSCKVCHAAVRKRSLLTKHAWSHVDDPERLCGVCGERSGSAEELRSHLQRHQKTHSCHICGKSFLSVIGFNGHVTRHKGKRPYQCNVCHKAFAQKSVLKTHKWTHALDKPQKCDVCSKSFITKSELTRHRRTHSGERLHRCDMCGKSLCSLRALSRHRRSHSGVKNTNRL